MSVYSQSYRQSIDQNGDVDETVIMALHEFPSIVEVLTGVKMRDGSGWETWPATLMIFLECGKAKFCLSPQQGSRVAFGTIKDLSKGLSSVEEAIRDGQFDWKKRKSVRQS